jgi:hypothetical protein
MKEAVLKIQTEGKFLKSDIILPIQSFQSLLDAHCGTDGRKIVQQVLRVALLFLVFGKVLPTLVEGSS